MRTVVFACMFASASVSAAPSIIGFDASRGGQGSLNAGSMTGLRTAIQAAYPGIPIDGVSTLSAANMQGHSVAFLGSGTAGQSAITPLSAAEQAALSSFVLAGNGALIFSDNDTFAGAASQPANLSLLAPWGMTSTGTGAPWERFSNVINFNTSPVTDGPFGTVTSHSVGWSGWFNTLGSATVLGRLADNAQPSLAVIPRGVLGPGSGAVVLFSDLTWTVDGFLNAAGKKLVLNALAFVAGPGCVGDLNSDGFVDDADFSLFAGAYNVLDCAEPAMPAGCPADLNHDGFVDDADFVIFIGAYNELVCS